MVKEGLQSSWRHCVDCIWSNQAIHVKRVRIAGIFGSSTPPEHTLFPCSMSGKSLPALAGKDVLETRIANLGVCNGDLSLEFGVSSFIEQQINWGVNTTHKERGH